MKNQIPEYVQTRVETIPESIIQGHIRPTSAKKLMIMESLKVMETGQGIVFTEEEFERDFGKCGLVTLKAFFKNHGMNKAGITKMGGKVYVFLRSKV